MTRRFTLGNADDGMYKEFIIDQGMCYHRLRSIGRDKIMARNAEIRKDATALKTTDWGKAAMEIPLQDLPALDKFFPGIGNTSDPNHKWAMRRFLEHPASRPYRLQDHKRRVVK